MDSHRTRPVARWAVPAGVGAVAALVPLLFAGPGTDLDTGAVIQSGRSIRTGDYVASRPPGAPVHEAAVGMLEWIGGTALSNAGTLAMAAVLIVALTVLLRREGAPHPELAAAVVAANPWFLVAATSTVDFPWAMALAVLGALVLRRGRPVPAGVLFGLAVGVRMSTVVVVAAVLIAESTGLGARRRPVLVSGLTATVVAAVAFIPPFLSAGSSLAFASNDFEAAAPHVHLGRALAKNLAFVGPFAFVALLVAAPPVAHALRWWRTSWLLRFGMVGFVASQLLFLRFPWKMGHLIPALVCLAVVLAVAVGHRPRLLAAIVALQLLFAVVNVELFEPNDPNRATGAELKLDLRWGPLVTDVACRLDDRDAWVGNDQERLEAVWNCAKPWGEGP
jgi:hypothetical protein